MPVEAGRGGAAFCFVWWLFYCVYWVSFISILLNHKANITLCNLRFICPLIVKHNMFNWKVQPYNDSIIAYIKGKHSAWFRLDLIPPFFSGRIVACQPLYINLIRQNITDSVLSSLLPPLLHALCIASSQHLLHHITYLHSLLQVWYQEMECDAGRIYSSWWDGWRFVDNTSMTTYSPICILCNINNNNYASDKPIHNIYILHNVGCCRFWLWYPLASW